ncbi:putative transcription factor B3-Domain family [Helianthus annuus]|nr:putative transcription factor B3-Domain family [Helianthus annuus]
MSSSCISVLDDDYSMKLVLPIEFVKSVYGDYWQRTKVMIHHESERSWTAYLRSISGESVITDGWKNVVRDLQLKKQTLLRLRILKDKDIHIDCFVNNICGESFVTVNRYGILKIIVIPEAYVTKCYSHTPVNDYYNICAAGQIWKVETEKINDNYVFTKGCPKLFDDLGIEDDDIMLLTNTESKKFEIKIYRRGVEVVLNKKEESDDESLMEIAKDTYYKTVNFSLGDDDDDSTDEMISEVTKKGKHVEAYYHAEVSKELICRTEFEMEKVSTDGEITRKRMVKEKRKRDDHGLKIAEVEGKVVAKTTTVEKIGKYDFTMKGENRMRMPANVVRAAGFRNKSHKLNVRNMKGKTIKMNVRRQKNGNAVRYAIEGWPMFMKENGLCLGDRLHFTFVSSSNLLILSNVDGVNPC